MNTELSPKPALARLPALLIFLAGGSLIMLVFSPWRTLIKDPTQDYLGRLGLVAGFLVLVLLAHKLKCLFAYKEVLTGLFILSAVVTLDRVFGLFAIDSLGASDAAPRGWAIQKAHESLIVISAILLLNKASGGSLGSLYIQKGKLKLGLLVGGIAFLVAAAGSFQMAALFKAENLTLARVSPWIPWLLIYVLCNGAMEELMFRGLFLRKLEPFCGRFGANFIVALVFTALHGTVTYSASNMIFLAVTFPLALAWGYLMQKSDSIWGSILFHVGMDIPIMLGIFSNL